MIIHREISANFEAAHVVMNEILEIAERDGLAGDALFEARLTMEEALVQAIKRRNHTVPFFRLLVKADVSAAGLKIAVYEIE